MRVEFLFITVFLVMVLSSCECSRKEQAPVRKPEGLAYCNFGPKVTVHDEVIEQDGCTGTMKVQGLSWKCGKQSEVSFVTDGFRRTLNGDAERMCLKYCADRASGCTGSYTVQTACGLDVDPQDANMTGETMECGETCTGRAFMFCSLYNTGFIHYDKALMDKQLPNCKCYPEK